jgi:hypothetical protein
MVHRDSFGGAETRLLAMGDKIQMRDGDAILVMVKTAR